MSLAISPISLFAQAAGAGDKPSAAGRVVYELARLQAFDDERLPLVLIAAAAIAIVALVWYVYRRDAVELSRPMRVGVALLRCVALAGLLCSFWASSGARRPRWYITHKSHCSSM
jgi:hypothetical protein